ncbi:hypothetical protein, partial [Mycobacterium tuberculosis]
GSRNTSPRVNRDRCWPPHRPRANPPWPRFGPCGRRCATRCACAAVPPR